ncbi:hypothetical protein ACI2KR_30995 [Pseudomonas luteola]
MYKDISEFIVQETSKQLTINAILVGMIVAVFLLNDEVTAGSVNVLLQLSLVLFSFVFFYSRKRKKDSQAAYRKYLDSLSLQKLNEALESPALSSHSHRMIKQHLNQHYNGIEAV